MKKYYEDPTFKLWIGFWTPTFKLGGGPKVPGPGFLFTPCPKHQTYIATYDKTNTDGFFYKSMISTLNNFPGYSFTEQIT